MKIAWCRVAYLTCCHVDQRYREFSPGDAVTDVDYGGYGVVLARTADCLDTT
jgi:hypothetical protein